VKVPALIEVIEVGNVTEVRKDQRLKVPKSMVATGVGSLIK